MTLERVTWNHEPRSICPMRARWDHHQIGVNDGMADLLRRDVFRHQTVSHRSVTCRSMHRRIVRTMPVSIKMMPSTGHFMRDDDSRLNTTTDLLEWGGEIIHPCLILPEALTATPQEFKMENNS